MIQFDRYIKSYALYQGLFLIALSIELLLLLLFFSFLTKSAFFALGLALFFFTLFSFFVFRVYYQASSGVQFESFIDVWAFSKEKPAKAVDYSHLSDTLLGREQTYYIPPKRLSRLAPALSKFSFWCHWEDLLAFRELLLKRALKEYYLAVRNEPMQPQAHAELSQVHLKLSSLYRHFSKKLKKEQILLFWTKGKIDRLESLFHSSILKAIEELKIYRDLAPEDIGADLQLALLYHELELVKEETRQYEEILEKVPYHEEASFKLGSLYFQQGMFAKGLQMYQLLKQNHHEQAEELLKYYKEE